MRFITAAAISRRTVTLLAVVLLLAGGVFAYNSLQVELFPEIEFPLVVVTTSYAGADPEGVVQDVTSPIERAISGAEGLETVQSNSFEGNSIVLATFAFGTDMANAESFVESAVGGLAFPSGAERPEVGRFDPDQFPVLQFSVVSDDGIEDLSDLVQSRILPQLSGIDGIMQIVVSGEVERQVQVAVDPDRMQASGVSLPQVAAALSENNVTLPAGLISGAGNSVPVKTTHTLGSVEDIRGLVVGVSPVGPVLLGDVAAVILTEGAPSSISRTNGKPAVSVSVVKEAESNTIEVTEAVRAALDGLTGLPPSVGIVIVSDQGPEIQEQIDTLLQEALYGFLFAVGVVFIFMLTIRPTVVRGLITTLRPTLVIALSIPLSVLTAVLLMTWQDMSLNFMTLGRAGYFRGAGGGRRHRGAGERVPAHSGGTGAVAGSAGGHHRGWPRDLGVDPDHDSGVRSPRLHRGTGGGVLLALRAHCGVRPSGVLGGGPDGRASAGSLPVAPRRPPRRSGGRRHRLRQRDLVAEDLHASVAMGLGPQGHDPAWSDCRYRGKPGPADPHSGDPVPQWRTAHRRNRVDHAPGTPAERTLAEIIQIEENVRDFGGYIHRHRGKHQPRFRRRPRLFQPSKYVGGVGRRPAR